MVLESLIGSEYAEKKPSEMFIVAFAYTTIAILLKKNKTFSTKHTFCLRKTILFHKNGSFA